MFKSNKCGRCEGRLKGVFSFCPYCGLDLRNPEADEREFGLLGKNDEVYGAPIEEGFGGFSINDRMINSIFNTLMKSFEKQMHNMSKEEDNFMKPEIQRFPNGIKIRMGSFPPGKKKEQKKIITDEQIKRMSQLPRSEARADVRRFSDRVVYELVAPGVESVEDIFVSKLENGYEVKAIGKKKVYVNSLPVNLPLKKYYIKDKKLSLEFGLG